MSKHFLCFRPDQALLKPLLSGVAILLLLLMFAKLSSEVFEGDTRGFDMYLLRRAQAMRVDHPQVVDVMRDLSGLGSTVLLALFSMVTVAILLLWNRGRRRRSWQARLSRGRSWST